MEAPADALSPVVIALSPHRCRPHVPLPIPPTQGGSRSDAVVHHITMHTPLPGGVLGVMVAYSLVLHSRIQHCTQFRGAVHIVKWTLLSVSDTSVGASPPLTLDPTSDPCKFLIKDHQHHDQALIWRPQYCKIYISFFLWCFTSLKQMMDIRGMDKV